MVVTLWVHPLEGGARIEEVGQYTIDLAQSEAKAAKQAIAGLDASEYRQAMMFLADYAVERSY